MSCCSSAKKWIKGFIINSGSNPVLTNNVNTKYCKTTEPELNLTGFVWFCQLKTNSVYWVCSIYASRDRPLDGLLKQTGCNQWLTFSTFIWTRIKKSYLTLTTLHLSPLWSSWKVGGGGGSIDWDILCWSILQNKNFGFIASYHISSDLKGLLHLHVVSLEMLT